MKSKMPGGGKRVSKTLVPKTVFKLGKSVLDPSDLFAGIPSNWSLREQESERIILADLADVGVICDNLDDLANNRAPIAAVPVLLRHLEEGHSKMVNTMLAWALQTRAIRHFWGDFLVVFRRCRSKLLGEDLAMAIVEGAGKEQIEDVVDMCGRKGCHGRDILIKWVKKRQQTRKGKGR